MEEGKICTACKHYLPLNHFRVKRNGSMLRQCITCLASSKASKDRARCRPYKQPIHENKEVIDICRAHIEAQFSEGMTWEHYEYVHIDHKVPYKYVETGRYPTLADVAMVCMKIHG